MGSPSVGLSCGRCWHSMGLAVLAVCLRKIGAHSHMWPRLLGTAPQGLTAALPFCLLLLHHCLHFIRFDLRCSTTHKWLLAALCSLSSNLYKISPLLALPPLYHCSSKAPSASCVSRREHWAWMSCKVPNKRWKVLLSIDRSCIKTLKTLCEGYGHCSKGSELFSSLC